MIRLHALLATAALFASGCALRPDAAQLQSLGTVELADLDIVEISYPGYLPPEYEIDDGNPMFGHILTMPIGLVLEVVNYNERNERQSHQLDSILDRMEVDVESYIHKWFAKEWEKSEIGELEFTEGASEGTGVLTFEVGYGLEGGNVYGQGWAPWVEVTARLWSAEDELIWKCTERSGEGDGAVKELPFPDPFIDERTVRANFRAAVHEVSKKLMRDLTWEKNKR